MSNLAKVHSVESFGTVDGPGIRYVIFFYGCLLKCLYCHNPDTWSQSREKQELLKKYTKEELLEEILKVKTFIASGGITLSGGEALLHYPFLQEFLPLIKKENLHIALDSAGSILNDEIKTLIKDYIDLVLLDIKAFDENLYFNLTSYKLSKTLEFLDYLKEINKKTWIRFVLVPNLTDDIKMIKNMANYLESFQDIIERIEILPFHKMGEYKWQELGLNYQLSKTKEPSFELINEVKSIFVSKNFFCP